MSQAWSYVCVVILVFPCLLVISMTFGGFLFCFVRLASTSALRRFGTDTTGLSSTFVPFNLMKFGTIRHTKAT